MQAIAELGGLKLNPDAFAQALVLTLAPRHAEELDAARGRRLQPLEHLDGRGLAGAVRPEQPETDAALHLEVDTGHCNQIAVALDQALTTNGGGVAHWARV